MLIMPQFFKQKGVKIKRRRSGATVIFKEAEDKGGENASEEETQTQGILKSKLMGHENNEL